MAQRTGPLVWKIRFDREVFGADLGEADGGVVVAAVGGVGLEEAGAERCPEGDVLCGDWVEHGER